MGPPMWKNKHLVVSMLVAPVLAIGAYFATDYVVSEPPQAARAGDSYPLMARSNCRYASGKCDLVNGDVELELTAGPGGAQVLLSSSLPLQNAGLAVAGSPADDRPPSALQPDNTTATRWSLALDAPPANTSVLRLVVTAGGSQYYAEVPAIFFQQEEQGTR